MKPSHPGCVSDQPCGLDSSERRQRPAEARPGRRIEVRARKAPRRRPPGGRRCWRRRPRRRRRRDSVPTGPPGREQGTRTRTPPGPARSFSVQPPVPPLGTSNRTRPGAPAARPCRCAWTAAEPLIGEAYSAAGVAGRRTAICFAAVARTLPRKPLRISPFETSNSLHSPGAMDVHDMTPRTSHSIPPTSLETLALGETLARHRAASSSGSRAEKTAWPSGARTRAFSMLASSFSSRARRDRPGCRAAWRSRPVGSFGRGAVALHSDADVVLIVDTQVVGAKEAGAFVEALLYPLWDAGLAVGHQVLSADEVVPLAQKYLETATALLDLRLLAGDESPRPHARRERERGALRRGGPRRVHRPARGRGDRAARPLRRLGVPARAGREERRRRAARSRRHPLGRARSLPRRRGVEQRDALARAVGRARPAGRPGRARGAARSPRPRSSSGACATACTCAQAGRPTGSPSTTRRRSPWRWATATIAGPSPPSASCRRTTCCARTVTRAPASLFERLRPQRRREKPTPDGRPRRRRPALRRARRASPGVAELAEGAGRSRCAPSPRASASARRSCRSRATPSRGAADDAAWCERLRATPEAAQLFVELAVHRARGARAPRARSSASCTTSACSWR